jgi:hypothetical protein
MNKEIIDKWSELDAVTTITKLGKEINPTANYFPQKVREDGLVEMTVEEHDGYEDENPREYMRFSFDGNNLLVSMTKSEKPILKLIDVSYMDRTDFQKDLRDLVTRK